jgi:hypothetical protein
MLRIKIPPAQSPKRRHSLLRFHRPGACLVTHFTSFDLGRHRQTRRCSPQRPRRPSRGHRTPASCCCRVMPKRRPAGGYCAAAQRTGTRAPRLATSAPRHRSIPQSANPLTTTGDYCLLYPITIPLSNCKCRFTDSVIHWSIHSPFACDSIVRA